MTTERKSTPLNRRPMSLRDWPSMVALAKAMRRLGATPNAVSIASAASSIAAAACLAGSRFVATPWAIALLLATPALVGLRGLCNLIDGMIAVEGGLRTKSGEVFNDFPDRVSDVALFVGAGYAVAFPGWASALGWLAACLSVLAAYTRMLGGATGARQYFNGIMAKPQRMAVLSLGCVAAAVERGVSGGAWSLAAALSVIAAGCVATVWLRLRLIVGELES